MQRFGQEQQRNDGSDLIYWIWLSKVSGIGNYTRHVLMEHFSNPQAVYHASENELLQVEGIGKRKAEQILLSRDLMPAETILLQCNKKGIRIMTMNHPFYPVPVKLIKDMPTHLYYKGNLVKDSMGTAIVGSRRCSNYGKNLAIEYAQLLAAKNIPVISGMAKGIDSYAHTACLKAGGYTVAVLGNGLDICYPSEHKLLMKRIEENGLLLSEYPPGERPSPTTFPARNRIIAAWSKEIIVAEARKGSGALITAEFGKIYGRRVSV